MAPQCAWPSWTLLVTLLLLSILSEGKAQLQCPADAVFGLTHLTDGLNVGSVAKFLCPSGQYAWPVNSRTCQANGQWSIMRSSTGRRITKVQCQKMRCPIPAQFQNGEYYPRGPYFIGSNITFECNDGYIPRGSMERTCMRNGKWSGETVVCDNGASHCADPGVPLGALKTGERYDVGESVSYTCASGLVLMGSAQRTCLESRRWSGTEVTCQYSYSFDLPEDVGHHFAGSLSGVLKTSEKKESVGRTVKIQKDGILNVYLLLDASKSVGEKNFKISTECAEILVETLGKFDMTVQFGIISYATESNVIVYVHDDGSDDVDEVERLINDNLKYSEHKDKSGTNIKGALNKVLDMMSFQKQHYQKEVWNSIHHVIILLTDGKSNMGGRPVDTVKRINELLDISQGREDYLDIYAFGIGDDPDDSELNDIASKKEKEKHVFKLEDADGLKNVFQDILKITKYGEMCGLNDEFSQEDKKFIYPWNVLMTTPTTEPCFGSLISKQWVLTAAHCFGGNIQPDSYSFKIGEDTYAGAQIEIHNCYNVRRKVKSGINEDYDYDVALVKLDRKVTFSKSASPICLPCTEPANRAMKKPKSATCTDHKEHLLASVDIPAGFLTKDRNKALSEEQRVTIKHNNGRAGCISTLKRWDQFKNISLDALVSERHFCVEGFMSCKGESGGSVFVDLRQRQRFFQVGIVSFGIFNPCKGSKRVQNDDARDFYVNVLEVLPFLRKHLAEELEFLPGIPSPEEVVCPEWPLL